MIEESDRFRLMAAEIHRLNVDIKAIETRLGLETRAPKTLEELIAACSAIMEAEK